MEEIIGDDMYTNYPYLILTQIIDTINKYNVNNFLLVSIILIVFTGSYLILG